MNANILIDFADEVSQLRQQHTFIT